MSIKRVVFYIFVIGFSFLTSCFNGIEPLPNKIKDLSISLSLPVGTGEFSINSAYFVGLPNINLSENVPEWAKHDTIFFTDTVPVDLSKIYEKSTTINYLEFKINVWNEYPAGCAVQVKFTDAARETLYSFWDNKPLMIPKGDIFADGKIFRPSYKGSVVSFDQAQIENLRTAENLIFLIKVGLKSTPLWSIKYFDNYKFTCQLGARVDFVLNNP